MGQHRKRLLLVGLGRWGKIFLKNILANPSAELAGVVTSRAAEVKSTIPSSCRCYSSLDSALQEVWDGVILATPPQVHGTQLKQVMSAGIPALVEKPLCLNVKEAEELQSLEKKLNARVLVDHVQLFHAGYERLWQETQGRPNLVIESEGGGHGPFRDYNALWDYGSHDLSMILDLMGEEPFELACRKTKEEQTADGLGANYETKLHFHRGSAVFRSGTLFAQKKRSLKVSWGRESGIVEDFPKPRLILNGNEIPIEHEPRPLERVLEVFLAGLGTTPILDRRWGLKLGLQVVSALEASGVKA